MASNHPGRCAKDDQQLYEDSLKFVRWDYQARNENEISVKVGDEVRLIEKEGNDFWKVELTAQKKIGTVPTKCFVPRMIVNWSYKNLVEKDEVVGVLTKNSMWKIMKKSGEECEVPSYCFNMCKEVHWPHSTLNPGDKVGVYHTKDGNNSQVKIRTEDGEEMTIPSHCFYKRQQVSCKYNGIISVEEGETIGIIKKDVIEGNQTMWQIRKSDGTIGLIPKYCFYTPCEVVENYNTANLKDIEIREGQTVVLADNDFAFFKVVVDGIIGLVPAKCLNSGLSVTKSDNSGNIEVLVTTEDVSFLVRQLHDNAFQWRMIGIALDFRVGVLNNIEKDCDGVVNCLTLLLSKWSEWPKPTLEDLCEALRSEIVGLAVTAKQIKDLANEIPSRKN